MSHGHCGVVRQSGRQALIDNDASLKLLARTADLSDRVGRDFLGHVA